MIDSLFSKSARLRAFFSFSLLFLEPGFLSVAHRTVANLARLPISVQFQFQLGTSI